MADNAFLAAFQRALLLKQDGATVAAPQQKRRAVAARRDTSLASPFMTRLPSALMENPIEDVGADHQRAVVAACWRNALRRA